MSWTKKYIQMPILSALIFGTAQSSPNFFACSLRLHDLANTCSQEHRRSVGDDPCPPQRNGHSRKAVETKPYLPCCESVVPFSSISEYRRTSTSTILLLISYPPKFNTSPGITRIVDKTFTPPPKTLGLEILDRMLRI